MNNLNKTEHNKMLDLSIKPPTRSAPKTMLIYGQPGVGKTPVTMMLPNHLLLDMDENAGSTYYKGVKETITSYEQLKQTEIELRTMVLNKFIPVVDKEVGLTGKDIKSLTNEDMAKILKYKDNVPDENWRDFYPVQFLIIDHIGILQNYANVLGLDALLKTPAGSKTNFIKGTDTLLAPELRPKKVTDADAYTKYEFLFNSLQGMMNRLVFCAPHTIFLGHVKTKFAGKDIGDIKKGIPNVSQDVIMTDEANVTMVDLIGALGAKVVSKLSVTMYIFRDEQQKLKFSTGQTSTSLTKSMVAPLFNKINEPFDWIKVFPFLKTEDLWNPNEGTDTKLYGNAK